VESVPRCRIELLGGSVGVVYEYADLKQKTDPSSDVIVSFDDPEIDWVAAEATSASRFALHLNSEASARAAVFSGAHGKPFRVSCDYQELFVGVLYPLEGAAALRTPVLHIADEPGDSDGIVLLLGAWQGAWAVPTSGDVALRERIDRSELRASFCARGILSELEAP
jgi:hypothetical protein